MPPLLDLNTWDVQDISELDDEYIEGTEDTRQGKRRQQGTFFRRSSMDSTIGILAAGKLRYTCQSILLATQVQ